MIKDCPIAKTKGKCPAPMRHIKKIEEGDDQNENDTPTNEIEEEDTQDFMEGDE
jgi:hypothetical protein